MQDRAALSPGKLPQRFGCRSRARAQPKLEVNDLGATGAFGFNCFPFRDTTTRGNAAEPGVGQRTPKVW